MVTVHHSNCVMLEKWADGNLATVHGGEDCPPDVERILASTKAARSFPLAADARAQKPLAL